MLMTHARSFALSTLGLLGLTISAATSAQAQESYKADPVHSSVVYRVKHMNASYSWGRFDDISGSFALDSADPSRMKLDFQVKTNSIDTNNKLRDTHLKGPDFFNAVQFPTISFTSKSVAKAKTGNAYQVTGDLTFHGVTKSVTAQVSPVGTGKDMKGKPIAGIEANFLLSQKDFGITKMAAAIGDEVWVIVSVEGIKQ